MKAPLQIRVADSVRQKSQAFITACEAVLELTGQDEIVGQYIHSRDVDVIDGFIFWFPVGTRCLMVALQRQGGTRFIEAKLNDPQHEMWEVK